MKDKRVKISMREARALHERMKKDAEVAEIAVETGLSISTVNMIKYGKGRYSVFVERPRRKKVAVGSKRR